MIGEAMRARVHAMRTRIVSVPSDRGERPFMK